MYLITEKESEVKTKIIVADFSLGQPIYEHIERELKDIPVGILGGFIMIICVYPWLDEGFSYLEVNLPS